MLVMLVGAAASARAAAPFNDNWLTPQDTPLNVLWQQDNTEATVQAGELTFCGASPAPEVGNTVWYRIRGTGGPITIATAGPVDTILGVYRDADPSQPANNISCNDDAGSGTGLSILTFNSVAGARYLVQLGGCITSGCGTPTGLITHVSLANDRRGFPEDLAGGTSVTRANYAAATETGETLACNGSAYAQTVWFHYVAPAPGMAVVSVSTFNDAVAIYQGTSPAPLGCAVGNAGSSPTGPRVGVEVRPGDYYIQVGTLAGGGPGSFNVQVEFTENRDVDRDGESKDSDCDDNDPARHHGAPDVPGNGVDEDCSGADTPPDTDGDGIPDAADRCPTQSGAARDVNRDGCLDPLAFSADTSLRASPTRRGVKILRLRVTAPKGAKVIVSCTRGCRKATKTATRGRTRPVDFTGLRNRTLGSGTRVRIWITLNGSIGQYYVYTITRGNFKKSRVQCLPPGSLKPRTKCT